MSLHLSSVFPIVGKFSWKRIDQGQDFQASPGSAVLAPYDGVITIASPNPSTSGGGFGTRFPLLRVTSGPLKGRTLYFGHTLAATTGQVKAGQVIAHTARASSVNNGGAPAGWAEIGFWGPSGPPVMGAGTEVSRVLHGLSGNHLNVIGPMPHGGSDNASGGILGPLTTADANATGDVVKAGYEAAKAAAELASKIGWVFSSQGLLTIALVLVGAALALTGLARTVGMGAPHLPRVMPIPI
ncbi:MAG: hypothetical protein ACR2J6_05380 [Thermoleophilaceae bacterium]